MAGVSHHGDVVELTVRFAGHCPPSRRCRQTDGRRVRDRLPPLEYPGHFQVKKITTAGTFRFQHRLLYLANAMVDQQIGLEETDDGIWAIHFNTVLLATFDERDYIITS